MKAKVVWYDPDRGYGFLLPFINGRVSGDKKGTIFFHYSAILDDPGSDDRVNLEVGAIVSYELGEHHGKSVAVDIRTIERAKDRVTDDPQLALGLVKPNPLTIPPSKDDEAVQS